MKPIVFTGDSFTFGEGLELYDKTFHDFVKKLTLSSEKLSKGKYQPVMGIQDDYYYNWVRFEDSCWGGTASNIRNKYKFPTLVSENLDTLFFSKGFNGGDNNEALHFAESILRLYSPTDISCVILNLTSMERDEFESGKRFLLNEYNINFGFTGPGKLNDFMYHWFRWDYEYSSAKFSENKEEYVRFFENKIDINHAIKLQEIYKTYTDFEQDMHTRSYRSMIDKIKEIKVPVYIIGHWNAFDNTILNSLNDDDIIKYIINKTIPIKIENKSYNSLSELPHRNDLFISDEFEWTLNNHPSKLLHEIIANSITEFLKENYTLNII